MSLKIGVLLAKSDMYPSLGLDFMNGIKMAFTASTTIDTPQFIIENVGIAVDDTVLRIAEKLILHEEVDGLIAFCGSVKIAALTSIVTGYKKPLIHVDLGANVVKEQFKSPYVLHHTLNLWQSCYEAGVYANTFGNLATIAASFYDGGYQMTQSFANGFADSGGKINNFFVSNQDYKLESFEKLITNIIEEKPSVVFLLFSYKEAIKVFEKLAEIDLGETTLITTPIMTDENAHHKDYGLNIQSIANWSFDDTSSEMKKFLIEYQEKHLEKPNIFSLMGFEIGQTILAATQIGKWGPKISEALKGKKIDSPRGKLFYNDANESQLETFKVRSLRFEEGVIRNDIIKTINISENNFDYSKFEEIPYTGWQNPYICT